MGKRKKKLTPAEKAEKKRRQREYMTIFINGKQKQVKRPPFDVSDVFRDCTGVGNSGSAKYMTKQIWLPSALCPEIMLSEMENRS